MQNNPTLSLRKLKPEDIAFLWPWYQEHIAINFPGQTPKEGFLKNDLSVIEGKKRVALLGDVPVGFIWVSADYNIFEDKIEAKLRFLHVAKGYRKCGIGSYLMEQVELLAKELGAEYISLGTRFQNKASRTLYNKMGYRPVRVIYHKEVK